MQQKQSPRGALQKKCREIFGVTVTFGKFLLYYTSNIPINSLLQRLFNNYNTHRGWVCLNVFRDVASRKTRGWVLLHKSFSRYGQKNQKAFFCTIDEIGISLTQNINGKFTYINGHIIFVVILYLRSFLYKVVH